MENCHKMCNFTVLTGVLFQHTVNFGPAYSDIVKFSLMDFQNIKMYIPFAKVL